VRVVGIHEHPVHVEDDCLARGHGRTVVALATGRQTFGTAFGILYAAIFLLWGFAAAFTGWGGEMAEMVGDIYPGFGATAVGAFVGVIYGFVVGFVFFGAAAWIYNRLLGGGAT
jgi:hypothetical protein